MRSINDAGESLIKSFEGCEKPIQGRPGYVTTYYDSVGVLTIGYGHTNLGNVLPHIKPGDIWSPGQVEDAFRADMARFETRVSGLCGDANLNANEFAALTSFDFNTGGLDRSSIPGLIKQGKHDQVPEVLSHWNHAGGKVLAGLTRRRKAEGELFRGNVAAALGIAGAHAAIAAPAERDMPKIIPTPKPPPAEVVKRTGHLIAIGGSGAGAAAHGQNHNQSNLIGIGVAIAIVAVVLFVRKYKGIVAAWA